VRVARTPPGLRARPECLERPRLRVFRLSDRPPEAHQHGRVRGVVSAPAPPRRSIRGRTEGSHRSAGGDRRRPHASCRAPADRLREPARGDPVRGDAMASPVARGCGDPAVGDEPVAARNRTRPRDRARRGACGAAAAAHVRAEPARTASEGARAGRGLRIRDGADRADHFRRAEGFRRPGNSARDRGGRSGDARTHGAPARFHATARRPRSVLGDHGVRRFASAGTGRRGTAVRPFPARDPTDRRSARHLGPARARHPRWAGTAVLPHPPRIPLLQVPVTFPALRGPRPGPARGMGSHARHRPPDAVRPSPYGRRRGTAVSRGVVSGSPARARRSEPAYRRRPLDDRAPLARTDRARPGGSNGALPHRRRRSRELRVRERVPPRARVDRRSVAL